VVEELVLVLRKHVERIAKRVLQLRLTLKPGAALSGLALLLVCSCGKSPPAVVATGTSAVAGALPGETIEQVFTRVLDSCMDSYGVKSNPPGPGEIARGYIEADPLTAAHIDECLAKANAANAPMLPPIDYDVAYPAIVKMIQCLRDAGFQMGVTVSKDEYVAKRTNVDAASEWTVVNQLPTFGNAMAKCEPKAPTT
jgi:hypothetical protein